MKKNEEESSIYYINAEIVPCVGMGCGNAQHGKCHADINSNNTLMRVTRLRYLKIVRQDVIKDIVSRLRKKPPDCFGNALKRSASFQGLHQRQRVRVAEAGTGGQSLGGAGDLAVQVLE